MNLSCFRAIDRPLLNHMERYGAWPRERIVAGWFKNHFGGYASNTFTAMKRGDYVPEKYVVGFFTLLGELAEAPEVRRAHRTLLLFLDRPTSFRIDARQVEAIVGLVCGPRFDAAPRSSKHVDYLAQGVRALGDYNGELAVEKNVRGIADPRSLVEAIGWNFVRVAQSAILGGSKLSRDAAEGAAADYLGVSKEAYARTLLSCRDRCPWSVTQAWHKNEPAGMSVVLPVTDATYERVRTEAVAPFELNGKDLAVTSLNLILEAASERPDLLAQREVNATKPLFLNIAYQVAALSRCGMLATPATLRLLAFATSPQIRARAICAGFVPTGTYMAHTRLEALERTLVVGQGGLDGTLDAPFLEMLSRLAPPEPPL